MTAHRNSPSTPVSVVCHEGSRGSLPGSASSSVKKSSQCAATPDPIRNPKTRRRSPGVNRWSGRPEAKWSAKAAAASARASASSPGARPRPGTSSCAWSGSNLSRSNDMSPVRWATAQRSGCTSAAAVAAAIRACSSPPMVRTSLHASRSSSSPLTALFSREATGCWRVGEVCTIRWAAYQPVPAIIDPLRGVPSMEPSFGASP